MSRWLFGGIRGGAGSVLLPLVVSLLHSASVTAQESTATTITISGDRPACAACVIELPVVVSIGGDADSIGLIGRDGERLSVGKGAIWIAPAALGHALAAIDWSGRHLHTTGRSGQGPLEHRFIETLTVGPDDTGHVFGDGRHAWVGPDGTFARSSRLAGSVLRALALPEGSVVVNGWVSARGAAGFPLHVLDRSGRVVTSFGAPAGPLDYGDFSGVRGLGPGPDKDSFWAARFDRYELTLWTVDGTLRKRVVRDVGWLRPWVRYKSAFRERPQPQLMGVYQDADGLLWTLSLVPDPDFRPITPDVWNPNMVRRKEDPWYDTIIEVLDADAGRLLAAARYDGMMHGFLPTGHVVSYAASPLGAQILELRRTRLVSGGR